MATKLECNVLEEVVRYLDGSYLHQIRALERDKERQVAAQNFDAAANIRDEQKALQAYWAPDALRRRVLYAMGRDVTDGN